MNPLNLREKFDGLEIEKLRVLDVGCGHYNTPISSQMRALPFKELYSVDKHAPVISKLMRQKFDAELHWYGVRDAGKMDTYTEHEVDVIVFLDVIEHFPKEVGIEILKAVKSIAKQRVLLWIPLNECPQDAFEGNPYQKHLSTWTAEDLEKLGYKVTVFKEFHKHFHPPIDAAWAVYDNNPVKHILVERLDVHGDVLVATSVLPGLQEKYPDAKIDWYVRAGFGFALENNPRIRHIIEGPLSTTKLNDLHKKYDLVLPLEHHNRWNKPMAEIHCEEAGVKFNPPELYITRSESRAVPKEYRDRILVANKAGWKSRECPNLNAVLHELSPDFPDFLQIDNGPTISDHIERAKGTLREMAAIMRWAKLYIGIDTVFMHMAVALGIPMVLFLGPTGPETQYIPKATFLRPFVHLNPAEPNTEFSHGIKLEPPQIYETILRGLDGHYGEVVYNTE